MKKTCLILIDCQNDFCSPEGSLFVKGAENDIVNINNFIDKKGNSLNKIVATMDTHYPFNITNPNFWKHPLERKTYKINIDDIKSSIGTDEAQEILKKISSKPIPKPFDVITLEDVENGIYETSNDYNPIPYLKHLEKNGSRLILWPSHCIVNTIGWLLDKSLVETLNKWCLNERDGYDTLFKGMHPHTDQYSIFNPEMCIDDEYGETSDNLLFLRMLSETYNEIIFCGEAADVCVKNSIKYLVESPFHWAEDVLKKSIIFKDCMSAINPDFNIDTDPVYVSAVEKGAKIINSTNYN